MALSPFTSEFEADRPDIQQQHFGGSREQAGRLSEIQSRGFNEAQGRQAGRADFARALGAREQQQGLADQFLAMIRGDRPSVAENQLMAGQDRALNNQLAMAASQRGNPALAMRQAARNSGDIQAQTNQQAAMLRAQEQAAARQGLAGLLGGMRGQDFQAAGLAQNQMGMNDAARQAFLNAMMQQAQGQMTANLATQELDANTLMALNQMGQQQDMFNQQANQQFMGALMNGAGGLLGAGVT